VAPAQLAERSRYRHADDPRGGLADQRPRKNLPPPGFGRPLGGRRRPGADEERDADADHRLRKDEQLETLRDGTGDCAAGDQPGAAKQQRLQPYAPASTRKPESGHPGGEPGRGSHLARGGGGDMEVRRDAREDRRNRDQAGLGGEERREEGDAHAAVVEVLCRVVRVHLGGSPSRCRHSHDTRAVNTRLRRGKTPGGCVL